MIASTRPVLVSVLAPARPRKPERIRAGDRGTTSTPTGAASSDFTVGAPAASARRYLWAALAVLCVGLFMLLLLGTIVNIAIPHIMTALETGLSSVEWVMNAYVLAFAVTLVTFGRFGDLYGRRRMYVGGKVLFTLASLAYGLAPGISWLIAFRVAQGLGGAMMMPATLSIVAAVFSAGRLSDAIGSRRIVAAGLFPLAFGITWMAGLTPWHEELRPDTAASSLVFPFIFSGIGIGLAIAPVTSAVMATAPPDRTGNASGVLSSTRQVGSLMGTAILGAVLQNRIVANVTAGAESIPGMPEAVKRSIVDGVDGAMQMGPPEGAAGMPEAARALMATLFRGWFTDAINTTFVVGVAFAAAGGVCALLLRSHVAPAVDAAAQPVDESVLAGAGKAAAVTVAGGPRPPASPGQTTPGSARSASGKENTAAAANEPARDVVP